MEKVHNLRFLCGHATTGRGVGGVQKWVKTCVCTRSVNTYKWTINNMGGVKMTVWQVERLIIIKIAAYY